MNNYSYNLFRHCTHVRTFLFCFVLLCFVFWFRCLVGFVVFLVVRSFVWFVCLVLLFVALEGTPEPADPISHVGPAFLRSKDLVLGTLFGKVPVHKTAAEFRVAAAGNALVHVHFQRELVIVRQFFHRGNVPLGDNHDALQNAVAAAAAVAVAVARILAVARIVGIGIVRIVIYSVVAADFFGRNLKGNDPGGAVGIAVVVGITPVSAAFGGINDQLRIDAELVVLDTFALVRLFTRIRHGRTHVLSDIFRHHVSLLKGLIGCE